MQDNYSKYDGDIDEQFENHAWEEMAKLLDQEMPRIPLVPEPVPASRRKYLLLLLLFLWVGTATGWWLSSKYYGRQEAKNNSNQEIVLEKAQQKTFLSEENSQLSAASTETMNTQANDPEKNENIAGAMLPPQGSMSKNLNQNTFNNTENGNADHWMTQKEKKSQDTDGQKNVKREDIDLYRQNYTTPNSINHHLPFTITTNSIDSQNTPAEKEVQEELPTALTQPIAMLDILNLNRIIGEKIEKEDIKKHQIDTPEKTLWKPDAIGVEFGIHSKKMGSLDGFSLGGILRYQTKASKFSMQTGLGYERIQTEGKSLNKLLKGREELAIDTNGLGAYSDQIVDVIYSTVDTLGGPIPPPTAEHQPGVNNEVIEQVLYYQSFTKLHYLTLPLQVNYRPISPLELNLGFKLSYLLGTTLRNIDSSMNSQTADEAINFKRTIAPENNKLSKFDARTYVGLTWYPKPALGLSLKYNIGLNQTFPSLNAEHWTNYRNNSWQMSMIYLF